MKTEEKHTANTNGFVADSLFDMHAAENSAPAKHQYTAGNAAYKQASSPEDISGTVAQAQAAPHIGVAVYAVGDEDMTASWMGIALSADRRHCAPARRPTSRCAYTRFSALPSTTRASHR